jgi:hypothetical protein
MRIASNVPGGGVGVARRGANLCPHSSQKIKWLGLPFPHLLQITGFVMGQRRTVDRQVVLCSEAEPEAPPAPVP